MTKPKPMVKTGFTCSRCELEILRKEGNCGTGYAVSHPTGEKTCYACCAAIDEAWMIEHGKMTLYLSRDEKDGLWWVTNWPGTLAYKAYGMRRGEHNMARVRYDVWFCGPDGCEWHGVQYGDNTQLVHCKRTKVRLQEAA